MKILNPPGTRKGSMAICADTKIVQSPFATHNTFDGTLTPWPQILLNEK